MSFAPAIQLEGLAIEAGKKRLLGPVDLSIASGEYVLVVGPSGSGKTTLLRAIAGLSVPAQGSIKLDDQLVSSPGKLSVPPQDRGVGMLFQGAALWPHLSVRKTLAFVLKPRKFAGSELNARIEELLDAVELSGFEDRMPGTLSGGERQRLALARALATEPRFLLMDEPLGPLDAELRSNLLERIERLHLDQEWTTLHVTHDPQPVRSIASREIRIENGQLVENPAEVTE